MANRRMFAKNIIDTDAFMDMPPTTQNLYFHLCIHADDDGFVGNPKKIIRSVGAAMDDFKILIAKRFVLVFESEVIVIKHWRIHNYIQKDRHRKTTYTKELESLTENEYGAYTEKEVMDTECIQNVSKMDSQVRLGKDRLVKDNIDKGTKKRFAPPSLQEVIDYCLKKRYTFQAEAFHAFYESNGWKVGKNPMKSWKAACITWQKRESDPINPKQPDKKPNFVDVRQIEMKVEKELCKIATDAQIKKLMDQIPERFWWMINKYLQKRYPDGGPAAFARCEREVKASMAQVSDLVAETVKGFGDE
jgi:hypothetical protein